MKILVIGNGFLARPIIEKLESEGNQLLVYSRRFAAELRSKQILGDIFNFEDFREVLAWKPQVIVHTAWITSHATHRNDPSNFKYADFTSRLAHEVSKSDVEHLIILGSCVEYGRQLEPSVAGRTKLLPNDIYAQQKVAAYTMAKEALHNSDARMTWARIFYAYGPGQSVYRLLPYLINELRKGAEIRLSDTTSILDWVTTRDIASAISFLIHNRTPLEVDVGTTFGYTNVELLERLKSLLGYSNPQTIITSEKVNEGSVYLVGKSSPLFESGWFARDTLDMGLEWVLNS